MADGPIAFIDSSTIVSLIDRTDATHATVVENYIMLLEAGYRLFTTNYCIAEVVSLLTDGCGADIARQFLRDHRLSVYHADEHDEQRARTMVMASRSAAGLSLVDAMSQVVLDRLDVQEAFAVDPNALSDNA